MRRPSTTLLAVDLSYQCYRAASAHGTLRSIEGEFTGGLFGFMVTMAKVIRECGATQMVVCEDVKPYRRSLVYPEYKQLRASTQDEELKEKYLTTVPQVKAMLELVGVPVMSYPGFESDDCIGHIVSQHRHRYEAIYAASNDSDLFALLTCPWFKVWRKGPDDVMDRKRLFTETGLEPEQYSLASALMGTHNDIAGIAGVGPKTAYKAVLNPGVLRQYRERHSSLIERNLSLIKLPHADFPRHAPVPRPHRSFDARALYRWCAKYDINVTTSVVNAFEQVCP